VVQGSRIVRIDPGAQNPTYDLGRLTIMPGWIDTHLHLGQHFDLDGRPHNQQAGETPQQIMLHMASNAYNLLMAGFTTVQSVGDANDKDLREWIKVRNLPGPRILTSLQSIGRNAGTAEQIRELVRQRKAAGADLIKVFAAGSIRDGAPLNMSQEQVDAACSEARTQGMRAIVHAGGADAAAAAAKAGCTNREPG
jgi:imidazolonepropionase-like amidohydrolase